MKFGILTADECDELKAKFDPTLEWGAFGRNLDQPERKIKIHDLDTDHIENILISCEPPANYRAAMLMVLKERYKNYEDEPRPFIEYIDRVDIALANLSGGKDTMDYDVTLDEIAECEEDGQTSEQCARWIFDTKLLTGD